jgi:hypothetical protein
MPHVIPAEAGIHAFAFGPAGVTQALWLTEKIKKRRPYAGC